MKEIYFGNTAESWLIACAASLIGFAILLTTIRVIRARLRILSKRTATMVDDFFYAIIEVTRTPFIAIVSFYLVSYFLKIEPSHRILLDRFFAIACTLQAALWGREGVDFWIEHYLKTKSTADPDSTTGIGLIHLATKFCLYAVLLLLAIHNLGFNISALIAGLGVGGIAVALAVQNILGDLFASLTIVLDKPFVVGDFIAVDDFLGTLEHIGLKTTRIRSLSGEELIFSNGDLLKSRVRNYKRMSERRVLFTLGVVYQTRPETVARIPKLIEDIIDKAQDTRFERCHFLRYGPSSLDIEIVYWVLKPDYNFYADLAHRINLDILKIFAEEGIDFAYPSQTLFIQNSRSPR